VKLKRWQKILGLIVLVGCITVLYIYSYPGAQTIFGGQIRSITSDVQGYNFNEGDDIPVNIEIIPYSELPNSYQAVGVYSFYVDGVWQSSGYLNVEDNERLYTEYVSGLATGLHEVRTVVAIMPYAAFDGCDNSFAHCGYSTNDHICPWNEIFTERLPCECVEEAGWDSNYGVNPNSNIDWFEYEIEWLIQTEFTEKVVVGDITVLSQGEYDNLVNQINSLEGDLNAQAQTIDSLEVDVSQKQAVINQLYNDLQISETEKQQLQERITELENERNIFEVIFDEINQFFGGIVEWFSGLI